MSAAPLILSTDAKTVLSVLLLAWLLAVVIWSLWVSWPQVPALRKPQEPRQPPEAPRPQARASRPRLTVLRGPQP